MEKIRIYTGRMENKYGVTVASVIDDPVYPNYTQDEIIEKLMNKLEFNPELGDDTYPGYWEDVGSFFDYDGYIDVNIPQSIIERIRAEK